MKIVHSSGEPYDVYPDMDIELTRYNPFFHELGEQSVPVSLPASQHNLRLLRYPERPDSLEKPLSRVDAVIQSGTFSTPGRQAILSAQKRGEISTSFYLNEGAFYEKISDISLSEIFENRSINLGSVENAINYLYSLVTDQSANFAVFPVKTDNYILNELSDQTNASGLYKFVKEEATEETVDDKTVSVPKGFYLTPFIKVRHVLEEVLEYFGYSLGSSFLDEYPFRDMVFLNPNIDTIIEGEINYIDVIPDIDVSALLEGLRKFNIEFVPDEINKTVNIETFNDTLSSPASADLSPYVISDPLISLPDNYRQLVLSSERVRHDAQNTYLPYTGQTILPGVTASPTSESETTDKGLYDLLAKYPTAYLRQADGAIVRDGFKGDRAFIDRIDSLSMKYYAGGSLPTEEHTFPDVMPDMFTQAKITYSGQTPVYSYKVFPYVGLERALRSKIIFSDDSVEESSSSQLSSMFCFFYRKPTHCEGTLYNYDSEGNRLWDYSLMWNGEGGIFEKFWRRRDDLLRNAMMQVEADLLLPENLKLTLPSTRCLYMNGQRYLLDSLTYSVRQRSVSNCILKSTKLQEPLSQARPANEYVREKKYRWIIKVSQAWPGSYNFLSEPVAFYPPDPTEAEYNAGGRYHQRSYQAKFTTGSYTGYVTVWLEPALY